MHVPDFCVLFSKLCNDGQWHLRLFLGNGTGAPAAGAGAGGDGGFASPATGALSATTALPTLPGDAFSPVRARALPAGDSSAGAAFGAGARGDGGFAPLAAGALAATLVLPPWIRVASGRLERVVGGGHAATAAYEPFGDPSTAPALRTSVSMEL